MGKRKLEKIGAMLFITAGISMLSVMFYDVISISIAFVWIALASIGLSLIVLSSYLSSIQKSPNKKTYTNQSEKYPDINKIRTGFRQFLIFPKIKKIFRRLPISKSIEYKNDYPKYHSLHADNLPQEDDSVNNSD